MVRALNLLSARFVATVMATGRHADGGGLYLQVRQRGGAVERLWLFRYRRGPRKGAREATLSLGRAGDVSLAQARALAGKCRTTLAMREDCASSPRPGNIPS